MRPIIKTLVIGAGAIGCLVGGRLASAGHEVILLGRPSLKQAVERAGLRLTWPDGHSQTLAPQVIESLTEAPLGWPSLDLVLVTVKSFDTVTAIAPLAGRIDPQTQVLCLANGLGNESLIAQALPGQPILAGSITLPVEVPQVGEIVVSKNKGGLGLASFAGPAQVEPVAHALRQAGFTVAEYADAASLKWSKLLMNLICNAVCAIVDMPPAEALQNRAIFNLELEALREALRVMAAQDVSVVALPSYPMPALAFALRSLPNWLLRPALRSNFTGGRGDKLPSLHLDLRQGRTQSEVAFYNLAVARAGDAVGVATPINRAVGQLLAAIVAGEAEWGRFRQNPAALLTYIRDLTA